MYSNTGAPTKRQNKSHTGRTLRHQANWRYAADSKRYNFPVTVRKITQS